MNQTFRSFSSYAVVSEEGLVVFFYMIASNKTFDKERFVFIDIGKCPVLHKNTQCSHYGLKSGWRP